PPAAKEAPAAREAPPAKPSAPKAEAPAPSAAPASEAKGEESLEDRLRTKSTPLVRRMAAEHNVDLSALSGSGMAGRVTKNDLLQHLESQPDATGSAPTASPPAQAVSQADGGAGVRVIPGPHVEPWEGDTVEPWSRIRKLTADHMVMSRRVSAHVASLIEIDYTHVARLRAQWKGEYAARGVNLTFLAFIAKAVATNLRKHKVVNAAVNGESTIFRRDINL
ncbi:MAG: 2-oxo acid dehydrogenase subunit E2, partial [Gemmatimonadales bacterium]